MVYKDQSVFGGKDCSQGTLVIQIPAITLSSDSAITISRFHPTIRSRSEKPKKGSFVNRFARKGCFLNTECFAWKSKAESQTPPRFGKIANFCEFSLFFPGEKRLLIHKNALFANQLTNRPSLGLIAGKSPEAAAVKLRFGVHGCPPMFPLFLLQILRFCERKAFGSAHFTAIPLLHAPL